MDPGESDLMIMNVYSKMKNLENKYIDLANFYKESHGKGDLSNNKSSMS